jgi:hypothetical protein
MSPTPPPDRDRSVSVIVAVYNGERFVADALASILGQTAPPDEVLVVDDGSTDGTGAMVARFPGVRCLRLDANGGQAAALNRGVASTRGAYLAFLDADDVWASDKLARQLAAFAAEPALDVVYGQARERIVGGAGGRGGDGRVLPAFLPSAMLIKRAAFERVGDFDPGFKLGSVVDWYARSRDAGLAERALDAVVYERRIHGDNVGIRQRGDRDEYLRVVKAALDRRRRGAAGPTPSQRLLLRALFGPAGEARAVYERWRAETTFDPLETGAIPLMPLLSFRLRALGVDDPAAPLLKGAHRKYWAQGSLLAARAAAAVRALGDARIAALATSGLALLAYYPDGIGCRPTADATLLVARASLDAAEAALASRPAAAGPIALRLRAADDARFPLSLARAVTRSVGAERFAAVPANELLFETCAAAAARGLSSDLLWAADVVQLVRTAGALDGARLADDARPPAARAAARAAFEALRDAGALAPAEVDPALASLGG